MKYVNSCTVLCYLVVLLSSSVQDDSNIANCTTEFMGHDIVINCLGNYRPEYVDCSWSYLIHSENRLLPHTTPNQINNHSIMCNTTVEQPHDGNNTIQLTIEPNNLTIPKILGNVALNIETPKSAPKIIFLGRQLYDNEELNVTADVNITINCSLLGGQPVVYRTQIECDNEIKALTNNQPSTKSDGPSTSMTVHIDEGMHRKSCSCSGEHISKKYNLNATVILNVQSPAMIDSFQIVPRTDDNEYVPGSQITLWCNVTGNPEPKVDIYYGNKTVESMRQQNNTDSNIVHHSIKHALVPTCNNTEIYTCSASNNLNNAISTKEIKFKINCHEVLHCNRSIPSFDVVEGENISISLCVLAYQKQTNFKLTKDKARRDSNIKSPGVEVGKESSNFWIIITVVTSTLSLTVVGVVAVTAIRERQINSISDHTADAAHEDKANCRNVNNSFGDLLSSKTEPRSFNRNEIKNPNQDRLGRTVSPEGLVYVSVVIDTTTKIPVLHQTKAKSSSTRINYAEIDFLATARNKNKRKK